MKVNHPRTPQMIHRFSTTKNSKYFSCITNFFALSAAGIILETIRAKLNKKISDVQLRSKARERRWLLWSGVLLRSRRGNNRSAHRRP